MKAMIQADFSILNPFGLYSYVATLRNIIFVHLFNFEQSEQILFLYEEQTYSF